MPKRPTGRPCKLTEAVEKQICAYIRAGAFSWVAAVASGVSRATFNRWMSEDSREFRDFRDKVEEARAQARATAEMEVRKMKPEVWLRLGPGRDKPGEPGWTEQQRHDVNVTGRGPGLVICLPPEDPEQ